VARRWGQRRWRAEAAELMAALPLSDDLPPEARASLASHVELVRVPAGAAVVRQGERGDRFYVIRAGTFEVSQRDAVGDERVLATLGRGRSFGELALLAATTRTATVRALEAGSVFAVSKAVFEQSLAGRLEVAADVRRSLSGAARLARLGPFLALGAADLARLQEHLVARQVGPGEVVVRQGEEGHSFFVVESGRLEVVVDEATVGHLEADSYFGELALLGDGVRAATVRALTPATLVELGRDGFDAVLAASFRGGGLAPSRALSREWEH